MPDDLRTRSSEEHLESAKRLLATGDSANTLIAIADALIAIADMMVDQRRSIGQSTGPRP